MRTKPTELEERAPGMKKALSVTLEAVSIALAGAPAA
jgi:hypothetical protein